MVIDRHLKGKRGEQEYIKFKESQGYYCTNKFIVRTQSRSPLACIDIIGVRQDNMFFALVKLFGKQSSPATGRYQAIDDLKRVRTLLPANVKLILAIKQDGGEWIEEVIT